MGLRELIVDAAWKDTYGNLWSNVLYREYPKPCQRLAFFPCNVVHASKLQNIMCVGTRCDTVGSGLNVILIRAEDRILPAFFSDLLWKRYWKKKDAEYCLLAGEDWEKKQSAELAPPPPAEISQPERRKRKSQPASSVPPTVQVGTPQLCLTWAQPSSCCSWLCLAGCRFIWLEQV